MLRTALRGFTLPGEAVQTLSPYLSRVLKTRYAQEIAALIEQPGTPGYKSCLAEVSYFPLLRSSKQKQIKIINMSIRQTFSETTRPAKPRQPKYTQQ
jgi:hypothetical protein